MAKLNRSEELHNIANQTLHGSVSCTGVWPPKTVVITTCCIFLVLSFVGNVVVVAVFYSSKTMRKPFYYFMVNMAISDLIVPVIVLPVMISYTYHDGLWLVGGVIGSVLCKLTNILNLSILVSILSMIAISADRFHTVLFPLKSTLISRNRCRSIIAAIWVAAVVLQAHYFYGAKLVNDNSGLHCIFQFEPALHTKEVIKITWISNFCLTCLSAIVLTVLYSSIVIVLFRQKKSYQMASEVVKKRTRKNCKITCLLAIVVIVFYAVWIPYHVLNFILFLKPNVRVPCIFIWLGSWVLPMLYTFINPVVYYIINKKYRKGFGKLFCCPWTCNTKCNEFLHPAVPPKDKNNIHSIGQASNAVCENIKLQKLGH